MKTPFLQRRSGDFPKGDRSETHEARVLVIDVWEAEVGQAHRGATLVVVSSQKETASR